MKSFTSVPISKITLACEHKDYNHTKVKEGDFGALHYWWHIVIDPEKNHGL